MARTKTTSAAQFSATIKLTAASEGEMTRRSVDLLGRVVTNPPVTLNLVSLKSTKPVFCRTISVH